jgi:hypothetical protein
MARGIETCDFRDFTGLHGKSWEFTRITGNSVSPTPRPWDNRRSKTRRRNHDGTKRSTQSYEDRIEAKKGLKHNAREGATSTVGRPASVSARNNAAKIVQQANRMMRRWEKASPQARQIFMEIVLGR